MFRSMTAYGKAYVPMDEGQFLIEIHSVNRKSLDIMINLPKELLMLDMELRKLLAKEVKRGFITVRVTREDSRSLVNAPLPDYDAMKALKEEWATCAEKLGYCPKEAISFSMLLDAGITSNGVSDLKLDETFQKQLKEGFRKALTDFIAMREKEGSSLLADIAPRLDEIEKIIRAIEGRVDAAPEKFKEKLTKKLEELNLLQEEGEERLMRELVLFAEKVDVTEELTRLKSHVGQFRELLASKKRRVGRELDFLIQEMNREVNTIAAKSQDLEITQAALEIKTEQEKIREQIQNIE